jgi:mRNA interferase RelE/StbE
LKGYYSVRAVGQCYRVVYKIQVLELEPEKPKQKDKQPVIDRVVTVLVIGIRKEGSKQDVYAIARKRLNE